MVDTAQAADAKNDEQSSYDLSPEIEAQLREVFKAFDESDDG